jgi:HEAT repeat protein
MTLGLSNAARFILNEVARVRRVEDPLVSQAADSLLALGEGGLAAARIAVASEHAPTMMAAVEVLLRSGKPEDADQVVMRLSTRMPVKAAGGAVRELLERDPVRATPRLLGELLAHQQTPVRAAASKALLARPGPELIPHLGPALESRNSDARFRAVDLLARMNHPDALEPLLEHLDDERAKVAWRVIEALAPMDDPRVEVELLRRAFADAWILRPNAYAILALVHREDLSLKPVFGAGHVETLLRSIDNRDPFVAGVCAAALAGIGFRSDDPAGTPWLDHRVPERLVSVVAGFRFFDDHEALQRPALARLKMISGVSHGSDGPKWAEWWLASEADFRASRAVLVVEPGAEKSVRLVVEDRAAGLGYALVGPAISQAEPPAGIGEVFYLQLAEAMDLAQVLREQGVFDSERLPGVRGGEANRGRILEVRVADQSKTFVFGPHAREDWFERVVSYAESLRDRNRWQRFPHPDVHGDRLGLAAAEGGWFQGDVTPAQRARRIKELVLAWLPTVLPEERGPGLQELQRLFREPGAADVTDFEKLAALLREERFFVGRAQTLTRLMRRAGGLDAEHPQGVVELEMTGNLVSLLHDHFAVDAAESIAELLGLGGRERLRAHAQDERPLVRALAASELAAGAEGDDVATLLALLDDPDEDVEIATIRALGRERVESMHEALLLRAGLGTPLVRSEALRAIGRVGGADARTVLLTNLTDPTGLYRSAAADGLAELRDPRDAEILIGLLRGGRRSDVYESARRGLLLLGTHAHAALFDALRSPSAATRREVALLLSYQGLPAAANALVRALAEDPSDVQVANELVVLTCIDLRNETDPPEAWWRWWDGVKHDDALSWFRAACEARGLPSPPADHFVVGAPSQDAVLFLLEGLRRSETWLVERARRELERLLEREIGDVPLAVQEREVWLTTLAEALLEER